MAPLGLQGTPPTIGHFDKASCNSKLNKNTTELPKLSTSFNVV